MRRPGRSATLLSMLLSVSLAGVAQQELPDAPHPQPASEQPQPETPALNGAPVSPSDQTQAPKGEVSSADREKENAEPPPAPGGRDPPSNRVANAPSSGYDETKGIIRVNVNAVPIPVTVKDATGRLFPGLTKD